ncbi:hypothetical protein BDQ12DRAFT_624508 [Crucibulum laeve]|uniref:DH domain-containing protein n=1 Tax=Crucibulum laeve TaxID=68775 RepID=A0A5C3MB17_9AGAR|nr:hypothetical protein BDQ12DRAFT_624508 [Crucibulum laeve]
MATVAPVTKLSWQHFSQPPTVFLPHNQPLHSPNGYLVTSPVFPHPDHPSHHPSGHLPLPTPPDDISTSDHDIPPPVSSSDTPTPTRLSYAPQPPHKAAIAAPPVSTTLSMSAATSSSFSFTSSLRRPNKLRKPPRVNTSPPRLQPLSFITEPNRDLGLGIYPNSSETSSIHSTDSDQFTSPEHTYIPPQNVARRSSSQTISSGRTISTSSHVPFLSRDRGRESSSKGASTTRKLTKRRPALATIPQSEPIPPSSSSAAAYAATAAVDAESSVESAMPDSPAYTQSEIGHGSSLIPKRHSLIRHFSLRSNRKQRTELSDEARSSWGEVASRAKSSRWRSTASESGHREPAEPFIPPVRALSPFSVVMPNDPNTSWGDAAQRLSLPHLSSDPGPSSAQQIHTESGQDLPRTRPKPKFTLSNESDADLSAPGISTASTSQVSISRLPQRPRLVRRDANVGNAAYGTQRRRWTLAMAMTDEGITDEVLVEELEKVVWRMRRDWTGSVDDMGSLWDADVGWEIWESHLEKDGQEERQRSWVEGSDAGHSDSGPSAWSGGRAVIHESPTVEKEDSGLPVGAKIPYTPSLPSFPLQHRLSTPAPSSMASWQTARRALLTCRELVRTERHYLNSLQSLLQCETATPPPALMLRYVGELVQVSEGLLGRMEENPSAWGVAAAFLGKEEGVENAFVSWCGVVGGWFVNEAEETNGKDRGRVTGSGSRSRRSSPTRARGEDEASPPISPLKRTVSTWRKSMTSIADINASIPPMPSTSSRGSFLGKKKERQGSETGQNQPPVPGMKRKPAVRDLAIQPTQRVMRYVLLYRDLLAHTPSTSPSRALVERAVEAACRVAQKCDRAQGNAAFFSDTKDGGSTNGPATAPSTVSRRKVAISMGTTPAPRPRADQGKMREL